MANWIIITDADLNDHQVAELVTALREEALGDTQGDPMPGIIAEVTNELRGAIAFSGRYELDAAAAAVPKSLREMVAKKIVRVMKGRLGQALAKDEERDADTYESRLKSLVKGEWPVDAPDAPLSPVPVQSTAATPRITPKCRRWTRANQEGA